MRKRKKRQNYTLSSPQQTTHKSTIPQTNRLPPMHRWLNLTKGQLFTMIVWILFLYAVHHWSSE